MRVLLPTTFILLSFSLFSQNLTQLSNWDPASIPGYNDIWGYVDCAGDEYAIVGSREKIHFIDISTPSNPVEVASFLGGQNTTWRDMKTYGKYAYAVCDACTEGLMIFDLSNLPNSVSLVYQSNTLFNGAHNIFIDEDNARLYAVGTNAQSNGVLILDLSTTPDDPTVLASVPLAGGYLHDIYVKNHIGYGFSGNDGLYVFDFTNASSPVFLGSLDGYPEEGYNHAGWLHPNGVELVFADETHDKSVKLVDVSDYTDMQVTGLFKSTLLAPTHTNSIAHNPFIRDDYAIVSYYHDGVQIWDISDENNITHEAGFDTNTNHSNYNGYKGCWGVYPYLPSGNIIASDGENGLYVLQPTTITFNSIPLPSPPTATVTPAGPISICDGSSITLNAPTGYQLYTWYKDTTVVGNLDSLVVTTSGNYHVVICDGPCSATSSTVNVSIATTPSVALNVPTVNTICEGTTITFSVPSGAQTYQWYHDDTPVGTNSNSYDASLQGVYYVTASNGTCTATSQEVYLEVNPSPGADLNVSGPVSICEGDNFHIFTTSNASSYIWYRDGTIYDQGVTEIFVTDPGDYYLETSNGTCNAISDTVTVSVNLGPSVALNVPLYNELCDGQSLVISVPPGANSYEWIKDGTTVVGTTNSITVTESGDYYVIASASNCEITSETVTVDVFDYPDVTLNVPIYNQICDGQSVLIQVPSGANSYQWYWDNVLQPQSGNSILATASGDYFVIASNGNCSSTSQVVTVEVEAYPNVTLNVPLTNEICENQSLTISVPTGADNYEWFFNNTSLNLFTNSITVNTAGNYHVIASNGTCEATSQTTTLSLVPTPTISLNVPSYNEICEDETFTIVANNTGSTIEWYKDGVLLSETSNVLTASESGDYYAVGTNGDCSETSETVVLNVIDFPDVTLNTPLFNEICDGQQIIISVPSGASSYEWFESGNSLGIFTNSITVSQSGFYQVVAENSGCDASSDIVEVQIIDYPDITLSTPLFLEICEGETETISVPAGAEEYEWYLDNVPLNVNSNTITATNSGNYYVVAANGNCEATSQTVTLNVIDYPNVDLNVPNFNEICEGDQIQLSVQAGADTYEWFENGNSMGLFTNSISVGQAGIYQVVAKNADCEAISQNTEVQVLTYPDVTLSTPLFLEICDGETETISVPAGAEEYEWYLDNVPLNINANTITATNAGNYFVIAENGDCQATSQTVTLNVIDYPNVDLNVPNFNEICEGDQIQLSVQAGADAYEWFENGNSMGLFTNSISVGQAGIYQVVAKNADCEAISQNTEVQVLTYPDVTLSTPLFLEICDGETETISVPAGAEAYKWYLDNVPLNINANTITATNAGNYFVIAENGDCQATSQTVTLNVIDYPNVDLNVPNFNEICEGDQIQLSVQAGADTYEWFENGNSMGLFTNSISVGQAGIYHVVAKNADCEAISQNTEVQILTYPDVTLSTPLFLEICEGETETISVPAGAEEYEWYLDNVPLNVNSNTITATNSGNYFVIAENGDCQATSQTVTLNVIDYPNVDLNVPNFNEICEGDQIQLSVQAGADTYEWFENGNSMGLFTNSISVGQAGIYTVTASNSSCNATSQLAQIAVVEYPDVTLSNSTDIEICEGNVEEISIPSGADAYEWYLDDSPLGQNTNSINISQAGNYFVVAANGFCEATSEDINLNVVQYPEVTVSLAGDPVLCEGEILNIIVPAGAENYEWYNDDELVQNGNNFLTVSAEGNYQVVASNGDCAATSQETTVSVLQYPNVDLNVPLQNSICEGDSLQISVEPGADSYIWFDGVEPYSFGNVNEIAASETGSYIVVAANGDCISTSETVLLEVTDFPETTLSVPTQNTLCEGESLTIEIPLGADSYEWYKDDSPLNENSNAIEVTENGEYFVIATNKDCSANSEVVSVNFTQLPSVELTVPLTNTICEGESFQINIPAGADEYLWYKDDILLSENGFEIEVSEAGNYFVTAVNENCAVTSETVNLTITELPKVTLSSPLMNVICEDESLNIAVPTGADAYQWYQNGELMNDTDFEINTNEPGEYFVIAMNENCAVTSETVTLEVNTYPNVDYLISPKDTICEGENLEISVANGAENYQWFFNGNSTSENESSIMIEESGTYFVEASNGDCVSSSVAFSVAVLTSPDPTLSTPLDNEICEGESLNIAVPLGASAYEWYYNGTLMNVNSNEIEATQSGEYHVILSNAECAITSETVNLIVVDLPDVALSVPTQNTICEDDELKIAVDENAETYQWFLDGEMIPNTEFEITTSVAGAYQVQAANGDCVATSETVQLEVIEYPNVALNVPLTNEICEDDELHIAVAENADAYQWFLDGQAIPNTEFEITTSVAGEYFVEAANGNCAATSETVQLTVLSYPNATLNFPVQNQICDGQSLTLTAPFGAQTYEWYFNDVTLNEQGNEVDIEDTGTYYVIAKNGDCTDTSDVISLEVIDLPQLAISPAIIQFCEGESATIQVPNNFDSYQWYYEGEPIPGATQPTLELTESGDYWVAISLMDCENFSSTLTVEIFEPIVPTIQVDNNILTASNAVTYQWFLNGNPIPNATNVTYEALETGEYSVEIIDQNGCVASSETVSVIISRTNNWVLNWSFNIFPNPSSGIVNLEFELSNLTQISKIEIVNNLGQVLFEKKTQISNNHLETIDLEDLSSGVYWVKIIDKEGRFLAKKLMVD